MQEWRVPLTGAWSQQRVLGESGPSRKVNVIIGTIHQSHHVLMNGGLNAALFQVEGLLFYHPGLCGGGGIYVVCVWAPPHQIIFPFPLTLQTNPTRSPPPHPSNEHVSRAVLVSLDTCSKGPAARKVRGLPRRDCGAAGC